MRVPPQPQIALCAPVRRPSAANISLPPMRKRKAGRPPHTPAEKERRLVELLAGAAAPQAEICRLLGIDAKTLRRHYRAELDRGAAMVEAKLVLHLSRLASGHDGTALKAIQFSLQCRFGWSPYAPPPRAPRGAPLEAPD